MPEGRGNRAAEVVIVSRIMREIKETYAMPPRSRLHLAFKREKGKPKRRQSFSIAAFLYVYTLIALVTSISKSCADKVSF